MAGFIDWFILVPIKLGRISSSKYLKQPRALFLIAHLLKNSAYLKTFNQQLHLLTFAHRILWIVKAKSDIIPSIHVWYIYLHLPYTSTIPVGKYTIRPMDGMGHDFPNI